MRYVYYNSTYKTEIPDDTTEFNCCQEWLYELPELPQKLTRLRCYNNNIKYLSSHNCQMIKNMDSMKLDITENPVFDGYECKQDFQDSL
jgi:hypothetical protein